MTAYDEIAGEYYSHRHITSRNFDCATHGALRRLRWTQQDVPYVECGAGRGRTREFLGSRQSGLHIDLSGEMLRLSDREAATRVQADGLALPLRTGSIALLTAWLFDPFAESAFFREAARALTVGGELIGSLPTVLWGHTARTLLGLGLSTTTFEDESGGAVTVPSHLWSSDDLREALESQGLEVVDLVNGFLPAGAPRVSPHVEVVTKHLRVGPSDLPLVVVFSARRPG